MLGELAKSPDLDSVVIQNLPTEAHASGEQRCMFFFHLQLLQLIEEVFIDLDFASASKWNHPATTGWKRLITLLGQTAGHEGRLGIAETELWTTVSRLL